MPMTYNRDYLHHTLYRFVYSIFLVGAVFLLACNAGANQTLLFEAQELDLARHTSYIIEDKQAYDIQNIQSIHPENWTLNSKPKLNFGFIKHAVWLKGSITSNTQKPATWLLNVNYPPLDNIDIHISLNGEFLDPVKSGDSRPFSDRQLASKGYLYRLSLKKGDKVDYFLRIQSSGSMQVPLYITPVNTYIKNSEIQKMLISAFYGILLVMGLYNMFISVLVKDKDYAIYVLWVFSSLIFVLSLNGEGFQVFWPNHPAINDYALPISLGLSGLFNTLFALKFMRVEKNRPKLSKAYYLLLILYTLSIVISSQGDYSTSLRIVFSVNFITLIFISLSTVYLVIKKQQGARIFLLSFSLLILSAIILSLTSANIIQPNLVSIYANQIAMVLESVIFSLALAKKIDYEKSLRIIKEREVSVVTKVANENLTLYTQLFNNSPIAIFRFSNNGHIESFNPAFKGMFAPDTPNNICPFIFENTEVLDRTLKTLNSESVFCSELKLATSGNWISLTIIGYQNHTNQQPIFEGHALDISQKKEAEEKNKKLEEQKSKMLSRLVSGIAHEINTPVGTNITAISLLEGEVEKINQDFQNNSITKDTFLEFITCCNSILNILNTNEHRTSLLVKRFKDVSIDQLALSQSEFDIYQILNKHISENPINNCQVILKKPSHPCIVNSYEQAFTMIIDNLIDNSIKYKNKKAVHIDIRLYRDNNIITLIYKDDGPGVEKAVQEHIFEPFYTSCPGDTNSTGLGLFVIYNLCEQLLNARIQLEPQPGFTLKIELPITASV
jgi:PAS domain S-box-containing protein